MKLSWGFWFQTRKIKNTHAKGQWISASTEALERLQNNVKTLRKGDKFQKNKIILQGHIQDAMNQE